MGFHSPDVSSLGTAEPVVSRGFEFGLDEDHLETPRQDLWVLEMFMVGAVSVSSSTANG